MDCYQCLNIILRHRNIIQYRESKLRLFPFLKIIIQEGMVTLYQSYVVQTHLAKQFKRNINQWLRPNSMVWSLSFWKVYQRCRYEFFPDLPWYSKDGAYFKQDDIYSLWANIYPLWPYNNLVVYWKCTQFDCLRQCTGMIHSYGCSSIAAPLEASGQMLASHLLVSWITSLCRIWFTLHTAMHNNEEESLEPISKELVLCLTANIQKPL